jgi:hypothetical protein
MYRFGTYDSNESNETSDWLDAETARSLMTQIEKDLTRLPSVVSTRAVLRARIITLAGKPEWDAQGEQFFLDSIRSFMYVTWGTEAIAKFEALIA